MKTFNDQVQKGQENSKKVQEMLLHHTPKWYIMMKCCYRLPPELFPKHKDVSLRPLWAHATLLQDLQSSLPQQTKQFN